MTSHSDFDPRPVLPLLWLTVLLNSLLRDAHEVLRPGFLAEIANGTLNGTALGDLFFVMGALVLQVPVAMVVLSRILPPRALCWTSVVTVGLTLLGIVFADRADGDDLVFIIAQSVALLSILWLLFRWRRTESWANTAIS